MTGVQTCALPIYAQEGAGLDGALTSQVRQMALDATRGVSTAGAGPAAPRVEVSVGQLDARLRLAPCERVEPYLPPGARVWGKTRVGLRCVQGPSRWNVYLPVTVKVYGPALVLRSALPGGALLTSADVATAEVDLAEDPSAAIVDAGAVLGRALAQPLQAGQSLRAVHLKARVWFAPGDTVKLLARGDGFSVAGEGQAMSSGVEGQPARVRLDSGKVLNGQPVADRLVELLL